MKSFILKSIAVLLGFVPILIGIWFFPVSPKLKYEFTKGECNQRSLHFYERVYAISSPIDIAFIGSSHTTNGINDTLIKQQLNQNDVHLNIENLGFCRFGRNLDFVFIKELLTQKKPKSIILEVREDEDRYSHPVFPYLASPSDVANTSVLFNRDIAKDMYRSWIAKLEIEKEWLFKGEPKSNNPDLFGFSTSKDTAEPTFLKEIAQKRSLKTIPSKGIPHYFYSKYPISYLYKIAEICKKHKVELTLLYLPSFGGQKRPADEVTYSKLGNLLIPPSEILNNPNNWYDENHLNFAGSKKISTWLAKAYFLKKNT
jgi:hypothetical protein